MTITYHLCSRCGIAVPETTDRNRVCPDCRPWQDGDPADTHDRPVDPDRVRREMARRRRAERREAEERSLAYHRAFVERYGAVLGGRK